jgi:AraC-like DNA-binding protein
MPGVSAAIPVPREFQEAPGRMVARRSRTTREWTISWTQAEWLRPHRIVAVGVSRATRGFAFAGQMRGMCVLMACLEGHGRAQVGTQAVSFAAGQVYRMPLNQWYAYWAERAPWRLAWICYAAPKPRDSLWTGPATLLPGDGRWLHELLAALRGEVEGERDAGIIAPMASLIDRTARRLSGIIPPQDPLAALWAQVDADPVHAWHLGELASRCGMSVESLRLLSRRHAGRSPMAQVTWLRMQQARRLLSENELSVAVIAGRVGYDNPFAFSTAFKRCMQLPPSHYQSHASPGVPLGGG